MKGIESFGQHLIKGEKSRRVISLQEGIHQRKAVLIVEHIQIAEDILIFHIGSAERDGLVEYCKGIAHRAISLMGNDMQRLVIYGHPFLRRYHTEVDYDILDCDSVEIVGLATRKDGRQNLMFLSSREDEDCMRRRFLECLEEGVECGLRQHVHLVDDIDAVLSDLRRYAHLVHQGLYVLDTVVGCGIELMDAVRTTFGEGKAGLAFSAWFHIRRRVGTVDHLREDSCGRGLSHASRSAEEICMCKLSPQDGILESLGYIVLTYKGSE